MKRRLAIDLGIALTCAPLFAAADPMLPAAPSVVDCLWSGTPQRFRRSLDPAVDAEHFDHLLDGWRPSDQLLTALADRCHVAGATDQPAYQVAALAIISKARFAWAQARLTNVYKVTPAQLEDAWKQISPPDRAMLARFMLTLDPDLFDKLNAPLAAFTTALHASDPDEVATTIAYLYGRALVETLKPGAG